MHYGLDIGPGAIRAATDAGDGPTIDSIPPVVVPVDEGDLEAAGPSGAGSTVRVDGTTHAVGAAARAVADADVAANTEPESLFAAGVPATETAVDAPTALNALLDDVMGDATDGRLCYTTPGSLVDAAVPTDAHREAVESALADRGVDATPISKGFAVVYDQLAADNYTGLGICLESQTTSAALAYYGRAGDGRDDRERARVDRRARGRGDRARAGHRSPACSRSSSSIPTRRRAISRTRLREPTTRSSPN